MNYSVVIWLVYRGCVKELNPPSDLIPHTCTPLKDKCPEGSGAEISRLCEKTTPNFNVTSQDENYMPFANTFCKHCWTSRYQSHGMCDMANFCDSLCTESRYSCDKKGGFDYSYYYY